MKMFSFDSSSSSTIPVSVYFFIIILCSSSDALIKIPANETVPALIVFGDSIVDPGNNNHLVTIAMCDFPPYGQDFDGGKPTGRFTNGRIPSDFIAEELGIKKLVPAYLDPTLQPADLLTGVSFASGASGYDPVTAKLSLVYSLSDQLEKFKEYIGKVEGMVGEEGTTSILSQSLFLVVQGSNDISGHIWTFVVDSIIFQIIPFSYLCRSYGKLGFFFLEGIVRIGGTEDSSILCTPVRVPAITEKHSVGEQRVCVQEYNEASKLFNAKLSAELDSLNSNFPNGRFVYIDIYNPLLDLIQNPQKAGFEVADRGCCGTGLIEVALLCNKYNPFTCDDVNKYVFWDSYHPTERLYNILISGIIQDYVYKFL